MILENIQIRSRVYFQLIFEEEFIELGRYNLMLKSPYDTNFLLATTFKWCLLPGVGLVLVGNIICILWCFFAYNLMENALYNFNIIFFIISSKPVIWPCRVGTSEKSCGYGEPDEYYFMILF